MQACKSSTKKGYVQINQKEYEEQIQGLIEAVHKEKELNDKLLEEREQNPISPVIQEEEMIFDMMERQELPVESRESYVYIPAEREAVSPMDSSRLVRSSLMGHQEGS